mgnify:CR=1 FL=1
MQRENGREKKVAEIIQKEVAILLQRELRDPRLGMVTVNEVRVSKDCAFSDIYFTVLPEDSSDEAELLLNKASGFFRSKLAKKLFIRTTPKLRFRYDPSLGEGARISSLIAEEKRKALRTSRKKPKI